MSATTLETLRADFENACSGHRYWGSAECSEDIDDAAFYSRFDHTDIGSELRIFQTAATFAIARDHGFNAAMLYKVSDGAIDPRKGGDA